MIRCKRLLNMFKHHTPAARHGIILFRSELHPGIQNLTLEILVCSVLIHQMRQKLGISSPVVWTCHWGHYQ